MSAILIRSPRRPGCRYGQRPIAAGAPADGGDDQTNKRKRDGDEVVAAAEDDMAFLYNTDGAGGAATPAAAPAAASGVGVGGEKEEIALKVEDSLAGTGVLKDLTYGEVTVRSSDDDGGGEDGKADTGLVVCGGEGRFGCLHILRASIVPELITEVRSSALLLSISLP